MYGNGRDIVFVCVGDSRQVMVGERKEVVALDQCMFRVDRRMYTREKERTGSEAARPKR